MNKIALATPALAALLLAGCSSTTDEATTPIASATDAMTPTESAETATSQPMTETPDAMVSDSMTTGGQYVSESEFRADEAAFEDGNTVLFFYAAWCPDCQKTDASIQDTGVPEDINIVKIDFDNANDLRKKYGVTQQHTYVLIGPGGEELKKWTGSLSADDIASKAV